ncbi:MAG: acyl-CoA thioesterase [Prevotella sp.]|jgi:acyl-CoA thioester hydrolase|nr:acyl-CoA thioesterase [Prevotella sp.]
MEKINYIFETKMEVRDYECDIEGIVNNANYLHYMEHTRHRFLKTTGLSFAEMHSRGIDAVVARMNLQYKRPFMCDDVIVSRLALKKQGIRYIFQQDLYRESDNTLCFRGTAELVCLINGRPDNCDEYDKAFAPYLTEEEKK